MPALGAMLLDAVRPRHVRDLVLTMRDAGKLAPRTMRQVTSLLHPMFKSAAIEEAVATNPDRPRAWDAAEEGRQGSDVEG